VSPLDRDAIERANLRDMINRPESVPVYRDECGLLPRHFKDPFYRRAYAAILEAASTGAAIPDDVLRLLAARDGER
jgi:hypothetical protein